MGLDQPLGQRQPEPGAGALPVRVAGLLEFLEDAPLVGRLFRSKIDQNIKRNLIIFVTARLIDPSGQPLLSTTEEDEDIAPLSGPDTYVQPPGPLPNYYKK